MNTLKNQYDQLIKRSGKDFTLIKKSKLIVKEINDNENSIDSKYIYVNNKISLQQGDIIELLGFRWLILTKNENVNNVYSIYTVRKLTDVIKIMFPIYTSNPKDAKAELKEFDCFIDDKVFDIDTGTDIILPADAIYVTLPADVNSNKIKRDMRFIKFDSGWKVTGINKTKEGLVKLTCQFSDVMETDDMENEIADYWKYNKKDSEEKPNTDDEPVIEPDKPDPKPEEPKGDTTYEFTSDFEYSPFIVPKSMGQTITLHKYVDKKEVDGKFEFTLDLNGVRDKDIEYKSTNNNQFYIKNLEIKQKTIAYLKAIDTETKEELKQKITFKGLF